MSEDEAEAMTSRSGDDAEACATPAPKRRDLVELMASLWCRWAPFRCLQGNLAFAVGVMVGVLCTNLFVGHRVIYTSGGTLEHRYRFDADSGANGGAVATVVASKSALRGGFGAPNFEEEKSERIAGSEVKNRVYFGVLTAKKYLNTRSRAVYNTWGRQVDKVNFFVGERGGERDDDVISKDTSLPVIYLKDTSDVDYPPQKKMFAMMKHICKYHLDDFDWFVRADDDLYVRFKQLKILLTSIDSDRMMYMGQPGKGIPEMREKIGLDGHNFCMGGPGVLLNRLAMKELCPHLDECEREVASNEEDVEIGRCVTKHLHIECTNNWETLKLFYHSYSSDYVEDRPFQGNLAENQHLRVATTMHYLKLPLLMYRLHRHFAVVDHLAAAEEVRALADELELVHKKVSGFYKSARRHPAAETSHLSSSSSALERRSVFARANAIGEWKTTTLTSQLTTCPSRPVADLTGHLLVDAKQVGERAIDVAVMTIDDDDDDDVSQMTYDHVIGAYEWCGVGEGCSFLYDVMFRHRKNIDRHQIRRVELKRPLLSQSQSQVTDLNLFQPDESRGGGDVSYHVIAVTRRRRSRAFESFMREVWERHLAADDDDDKIQVIAAVASSAPDEAPEQVPQVSEVVGWHRVKRPGARLSVADAAGAEKGNRTVTDAVRHALRLIADDGRMNDAENVVLVASPSLRFDARLLVTCRSMTSPGGDDATARIYQPVPARVYEAADDDGWWDPAVAPSCGRLEDFRRLLEGAAELSSALEDRHARVIRAPSTRLTAPVT